MQNTPKHILVVYYSQSGQLRRVIESVCGPLKEAEQIQLHELVLTPKQDFPFPWPFLSFFNHFPECVYLDPPELEPLELDESIDYDLIILAYQPWFLSPSMPITAFLQSDTAGKILKDKPVMTLIACRNMWTQAQLAISTMLESIGAKLIDNAVLVDQGSTMASFITTPRWMLTGRKTAFWGLPEAGVAEADISSACRFGLAIRDGLATNLEQTGKPLLAGLEAVKADVGLIQSEMIGYRSFRIWGKLLRAIGNRESAIRKSVLIFYIIFLICLILSVVPVVSLIKWLTRPLLKTRHKEIKDRFELPSGSGNERVEKYTCQK